jgi:hypothetical protein
MAHIHSELWGPCEPCGERETRITELEAERNRMAAAIEAAQTDDTGFSATVLTGRLVMDFGEFQSRAEKLLGRPILTHEFGDKATWEELHTALAALVGTRQRWRDSTIGP